MSQFDELTPEEQNKRVKKLEAKLKKKPSTDLETRWFDFSFRNVGFEFMNLKTGKIMTKLHFFQKFKDDHRTLNLASENVLNDWRRRIKDGWTAVDTGWGPAKAIRNEEMPIYKKKKAK